MEAATLRKVLSNVPQHRSIETPQVIRYPWDLVHANADMLEYGWRQAGCPAAIEGRVCEGVHFLNKSAVHIGRGSVIKTGVVLDAEQGPIFIGENVTISPNTSIEGPCYIGDGSLIQPGESVMVMLDSNHSKSHVLADVSKSCDYGNPHKATYIKQVAAALGYGVNVAREERQQRLPDAEHVARGHQHGAYRGAGHAVDEPREIAQSVPDRGLEAAHH